MHVTWSALLTSLVWAVLAGGLVWLALRPLRRRSMRGLLISLVLVGAAASMAALWGAIRGMLVPALNLPTALALTAFSGAVTAVAAWAGARGLTRDAETLRHAVTELGAGRVPPADGPRLTAEVEQVRADLRATAAALAATRQRERALETARRELVSWVSHDLRTPLAGLRAMAEALEDGVTDEPEQYYKQISAAVERLAHMVDDLFDLSRIQAGVGPSETERLGLDDLVSDCVAALEPLAGAHGVVLTGSVDTAAPVVANGSELNRALTNLVGNAIRHTPAPGAVDVRVGARDDGSTAEVVVRDECGGIPGPHLPRVFDVGFRGETARTPHDTADASTDDSGAGLGLAITRGIVEAHGGHVEVVNRDGGCEFRVVLPLDRG